MALTCYRDLMGSILTRQWMMAALLALFVSLVAVVITADAAACAPEFGSSQSVLSVEAPGSDNDAPGSDNDGSTRDGAGLCSHGHVHNGAAVLPAPMTATSRIDPTARLANRPFANPMASRTPAGPDRPPRA